MLTLAERVGTVYDVRGTSDRQRTATEKRRGRLRDCTRPSILLSHPTVGK